MPSPRGKAKAKAVNCATIAESQAIEHSNVQNRKEKKDGEKEARHRKEKEKESRYRTCGMHSRRAKERAEEKEKDSKAIARDAESTGIRRESAEPSCQQEKWKKKRSQKSTGLA